MPTTGGEGWEGSFIKCCDFTAPEVWSWILGVTLGGCPLAGFLS